MGKTALVTGSSKGIGRAIVIELAKMGYDVAINHSNSEKDALEVQKICQDYGVKAITIKADVSKMEEIDFLFKTFFDNYNHIDVMVNNAGITRMIPFLEVTEENWDDVINLNFKGAYFCGQKAAQNMVKCGTKGLIINITSIHQEILFPHASVYGSGKAGLLKLTKHMALELAKHGIRVVSIAPGCIHNDPSKRESERAKLLKSRIPLRLYGECEDIAHVVGFLASGNADYITGVTIPVEGGVLLPPLIDYDVY